MTTVSRIPVTGGELTVGRWGTLGDAPPVLAIHGITANHLTWGLVAPLVPGPVVAPDLRKGADPRAAYEALPRDTVFLRAERGMFNEPRALYPDPDAIGLNVTTVPGTNHYTILLGEAGARAVADAVGSPA